MTSFVRLSSSARSARPPFGGGGLLSNRTKNLPTRRRRSDARKVSKRPAIMGNRVYALALPVTIAVIDMLHMQ